MTIYHIASTKRERGLSGGEVCMIEMVKYFRQKRLHNCILTSAIGKKVYEQSGLIEGTYVRYHLNDLTEQEAGYHIFISYLYCMLRAFYSVKLLSFADNDILFCHSNIFPDYFSAWVSRRNNPRVHVFFWFHLFVPRLFRGYEGEFTNIFKFPTPTILFHAINQLVFRLFVRSCDGIFTVSKQYERMVRHIFPHATVYGLKRFGGSSVARTSSKKKLYDCMWLGRFHPQKGLLELIDIVSEIVKVMPEVRVLVIGDGEMGIKQKFLFEIKKRNLQKNIMYKGQIIDTNKKLKYFGESKMFLMTSVYESFGLVVLEAMKNGMPVVAYDLPVYAPMNHGMITVPLLDNKRFAKVVVTLLNNRRIYLSQKKKSLYVGKKFSWKKTGNEVFSFIKPYV